jgi:hypothetical protein
MRRVPARRGCCRRARLRETDPIMSIAHKIIADGTNWCFLEELKRKLKT